MTQIKRTYLVMRVDTRSGIRDVHSRCTREAAANAECKKLNKIPSRFRFYVAESDPIDMEGYGTGIDCDGRRF
jgi:hypothetical protein